MTEAPKIAPPPKSAVPAPELSIPAEFPFPELYFPGRTTLSVDELARCMCVCPEHVINLVDRGALNAIGTGQGKKRQNYRIPVESWRSFVIARDSRNGRR
ncbi:MAG: hypothetical protein HY043_22740 [Verrucomicrobia bacterium]|nr:hypothetical protein [Verrucomicrobiota bacterium]